MLEPGHTYATVTDQMEINRDIARAWGVDPAGLIAKMNEASIAAIVASDAQNGRPYIMQGIPSLYVNGRYVPAAER